MNRWKSEENLQESAVFFLYEASGYVTQVTSLGSKHSYALIHIIGPWLRIQSWRDCLGLFE